MCHPCGGGVSSVCLFSSGLFLGTSRWSIRPIRAQRSVLVLRWLSGSHSGLSDGRGRGWGSAPPPTAVLNRLAVFVTQVVFSGDEGGGSSQPTLAPPGAGLEPVYTLGGSRTGYPNKPGWPLPFISEPQCINLPPLTVAINKGRSEPCVMGG